MSFVLGLNESGGSPYIQKWDQIQKNEKTIFIRNAESADGVFTFQYIGQVITDFQISYSGIYKIEAWGASGGGTNDAPKGAYSKSFVPLNKGERIQILVGEKGYDGYNSGNYVYCSGGGGGSFVAKGETPLCIAGGGGGNSYYSHDSVALHACGQSGQYGGDPHSRQVEVTYGGLAGASHSGGGGGFLYNGNNPPNSGKGGISFLNGGWRQNVSAVSGAAYGGFGGGGSSHGQCGQSGGGGGYTGGGGTSSDHIQAGGGGSFFTGEYSVYNSTAISGCSSFPAKPTSDLNGNVVLTIMGPIPYIKKFGTSSCHDFQISICILFSTLISY
jgi:hypothetical protein